MLNKLLQKYNIILGSASPRRKELLSDIGIEFNIQTTDKEEKYPSTLKEEKIAEFLAQQKSTFLSENQKNTDLLITADTIVAYESQVLNKPQNKEEAFNILNKLSGKTHKVITGVCVKSINREVTFSAITMVTFRKLKHEEIEYYINNFNPFDKAGAYGIQDWIGQIGIQRIDGSYSNVVGLPTKELYEQLELFI